MSGIFGLGCQVNILLDIEELACDNLLHETLDYVNLSFKLAHFSLDHVQGVPTEVRLWREIIRVEVVNFDLTASLAWTCIDGTVVTHELVTFVKRITSVPEWIITLAIISIVLLLHAPLEVIVAIVLVTVCRLVWISKFHVSVHVDLLHGRSTLIVDQRKMSLIDCVTVLSTHHALIATAKPAIRIAEIESIQQKKLS